MTIEYRGDIILYEILLLNIWIDLTMKIKQKMFNHLFKHAKIKLVCRITRYPIALYS